jgi:spore coat protein CotF
MRGDIVMTHQLTQKERSLLQDQMSHEEICIKKYSGYASLTKSQELRNLFNELAQEEQNHYDTLSRYLGNQGAMQQMGGMQQMGPKKQDYRARADFETASFDNQTHQWSAYGQEPRQAQQSQQGQLGQRGQTGTTDEAAICQDMLMTEKYISGAYDTTVFESVNPQLRKDLQKIQDDEQKHGEKIFNYMQKQGYYNPQ